MILTRDGTGRRNIALNYQNKIYMIKSGRRVKPKGLSTYAKYREHRPSRNPSRVTRCTLSPSLYLLLRGTGVAAQGAHLVQQHLHPFGHPSRIFKVSSIPRVQQSACAVVQLGAVRPAVQQERRDIKQGSTATRVTGVRSRISLEDTADKYER